VLAPVSLVDSNYDNFFDMAVVAIPKASSGPSTCSTPALSPAGLVNNWFWRLTFQQFKGGAISQRAPFTTMAGARVFDDSKGGVRVYLGSGDRDQIKVRDTDAADGGTCALRQPARLRPQQLHGGRQPDHLPGRPPEALPNR